MEGNDLQLNMFEDNKLVERDYCNKPQEEITDGDGCIRTVLRIFRGAKVVAINNQRRRMK